MVRRMIAAAEQSLIDQTASAVRSGFQSGLTGSSTGVSTNPFNVNESSLNPPNK
jgi:hypothetical protein